MTGAERRRVRPVRVLGLTLAAPWSAVILNADKRIENRNWKPGFLGGDWMALHGGKVAGAPDKLIQYAQDWWWSCQRAPQLANICPPPTPVGWDVDGYPVFDRRECVRLGIALKDEIPVGIFGVCKVRGSLYIPETAPLPLAADKWYAHGQHGWKMTETVLWRDTIPATGKQGFWPVEDDDTQQTLTLVKRNYKLQTGKDMT